MNGSEKGFSLLEVLIGVVLIGLVMAFAYTAINFSSNIEGDMEDTAKVSTILDAAAEFVMEFSRTSSGWANINETYLSSTEFVNMGTEAVEASLDGLRDLSVDFTVDDVDTVNQRLLQVTIDVQWKPRGRRILDASGLEQKKSESLVIYVSKPGV